MLAVWLGLSVLEGVTLGLALALDVELVLTVALGLVVVLGVEDGVGTMPHSARVTLMNVTLMPTPPNAPASPLSNPSPRIDSTTSGPSGK